MEILSGILNSLLHIGPVEKNHRTTKITPKVEHLQKLSLSPLVYIYREQRGEMIFMYQLTHQYFDIDASSLFDIMILLRLQDL